MEDNFRLGAGIGLVLTVSLATALQATTVTSTVRNIDNTENKLWLSEDITLAQFTIPDQVVDAPEPVDNIPIENDDRGEPNSDGASAGVSTASTTATTAITVQLEKGADRCERTPEIYRIDCLSQSYRDTAQKLSSRGDYSEARTVLLDTADKLDALVRSNRDRKQPRIHLKESPDGPRVNKRAFTPVKAQSVARVKRQAIPILEEASTKLLRSASASSTHYQRIAAAVDSNKVLLRSS